MASNLDSDYAPFSQTAQSPNRILEPQFELNAKQMQSYAFRNKLKIPTPFDIWRPAGNCDHPISTDDLMTFYNNTRDTLTYAIFHAAALKASRKEDDLKLAPMEQFDLTVEDYTVTLRFDDVFELGLLWVIDNDGRKILPQYPNTSRVEVRGGRGDFKLEFNGIPGHTIRGSIVRNQTVPQTSLNEIRIIKTDPDIECEVGVFKNNKLIMNVPIDSSMSLAKFELPNIYAVGVYTYRFKSHEEGRVGRLNPLSPGQILWTVEGENGAVTNSSTSNRGLLWIPTEKELEVIESGQETDPNY